MPEEDKIQFKAWLKKSTVDRLREYVSLKYQRVEKGLLSREVELALISHIKVGNTQAQITQSFNAQWTSDRTVPKVRLLFGEIKTYLRDIRNIENIRYVPVAFVTEAIASIKGTDSRTIKKWMKDLQKYGFIVQTGPGQCEFNERS